ncbi:MAG: hypothetical protein DRP56_00625 [Planctomycetota bacterium]|nr:MAG: hypothetical protein DRP56_00625 [Planctomycetota bacterium]
MPWLDKQFNQNNPADNTKQKFFWKIPIFFPAQTPFFVNSIQKFDFLSWILMKMNDFKTFEYGCQDTQELLTLLIVWPEELTFDERDEVGKHLSKCSVCRQDFVGMKHTSDALIANRDYLRNSGVFGKTRSNQPSIEMSHEEIMAERFQDRLNRTFTRRKRRERKEKIAKFKQLAKPVSAIAACLIIAFGLFMAANQLHKAQNDTSPVVSNQQQNPVKIEVISGDTTEIIPAGQRITAANGLKTLRINGNRQMVLNIGTELSIEPYNLGCLVRLDQGEIYTEVEHDGKPFMVETPHGRAVITGTTFNIKADNSKMDLAVIDGSVQFEAEKGTVIVQGGYQSSIVSGTTPTKPVACNTAGISQWATGQKTNEIIQVNQSDICFSELLDQPVSFLPYRDLEEIDFDIWISQHRPWFEREFPWTKRLQNILSIDGIQADTIDLLIESGDLRRFAWPEYAPQRCLSENKEIIQKAANQYGIEIDRLISAKSLIQSKRISNIEGFEKWLDAFDKDKGNLTLDSIHAAVFLVNTRSLMWFAVKNDKIQVQDKQQVLDLLAEQVKIASSSLETLSQLLLADKNESVCSVAQYEGYIKKMKDDISSMMEIEKELASYEVISE